MTLLGYSLQQNTSSVATYIALTDHECDFPTFSDKVKEDIYLDADTQFIWNLLSTDWEEESSTTQLNMNVNQECKRNK